jgi:hypothetical protein
MLLKLILSERFSLCQVLSDDGKSHVPIPYLVRAHAESSSGYFCSKFVEWGDANRYVCKLYDIIKEMEI